MTTNVLRNELPPPLPPSHQDGGSSNNSNNSSSNSSNRDDNANANASNSSAVWNHLAGFVVGVASGVTKLLVGHPWDVIKVRMQSDGQRFGGPWNCLRQTISQESVRALYKGASTPLLGWTLMDSVMLGTLVNSRLLIKQHILNDDPDLPLLFHHHAAAGLAAGITVSFVATPIELVKVKLQTQYARFGEGYIGPVECARRLVARYGPFKGLYTGLVGTMAMRGFLSVYWSSYEWYLSMLRKSFPNMSDTAATFYAGGVAASTYWTVVFPVDLVKNKYMALASPIGDDAAPQQKKITLRSVARHVYATEGWRGFFRGFTPAFIRAFPTNASAVFVFNLFGGFASTSS
ncbi:mitochondrial carrier [Ramicandelaber brevisporus]|nr:mitochondrial carrier [Ramicandelaber brevisporus]